MSKNIVSSLSDSSVMQIKAKELKQLVIDLDHAQDKYEGAREREDLANKKNTKAESIIEMLNTKCLEQNQLLNTVHNYEPSKKFKKRRTEEELDSDIDKKNKESQQLKDYNDKYDKMLLALYDKKYLK